MNIPAEIKVNGKWRPTRNSLGKLIHSTPEGLLAFWKWFGESKVVDDQGRPLVVYHNTDSEFDAFDLEAKLANTRGNIRGIYVTTRLWEKENRLYGSRYLDLYAKAVKPYSSRGDNTIGREMAREYRIRLRLENEHLEPNGRWFDEQVDYLKTTGKMRYTGLSSEAQRLVLLAGGFDSVEDGPHWALLHPTQIKSATGNRGTFDGADPVMTNPRRRRRK